jgi:hypothetical protein
MNTQITTQKEEGLVECGMRNAECGIRLLTSTATNQTSNIERSTPNIEPAIVLTACVGEGGDGMKVPSSKLQVQSRRSAERGMDIRPTTTFEQLLLDFIRGAKLSQKPQTAQAAREWEGVISFRIQLNRQNRQTRAFRSAARSRRGVAPAQG